MPRGHKTCSRCQASNGPRAYTCKKCGASFTIKGKNGEEALSNRDGRIDWKTLEKGDFIRTINGSGPYWSYADGRKQPMGYYGKFRVASLGPDGIHAYPVDRRNSGHCFIYMGIKKRLQTGEKSGLVKRPHKVRKLSKTPKITSPIMLHNSKNRAIVIGTEDDDSN